MPRHPQFERCGKPLADPRGGESLRRCPLRRDEPLPCPGIDHHGPEPGGEIVGSIGSEARGGIGDELAVARDVGGDHRRAAGHRLDHRHREPLRPRGDDGRRGMAVPAGELGVTDMVEELEPDHPAAGRGSRPCDAGSPSVGIAAGDHQGGIGAPGPRQRRHDRLEILARVGPTDKHHVVCGCRGRPRRRPPTGLERRKRSPEGDAGDFHALGIDPEPGDELVADGGGDREEEPGGGQPLAGCRIGEERRAAGEIAIGFEQRDEVVDDRAGEDLGPVEEPGDEPRVVGHRRQPEEHGRLAAARGE